MGRRGRASMTAPGRDEPPNTWPGNESVFAISDDH